MSLIPKGIPQLGLGLRRLAVHEHPGADALLQSVDLPQAGVEKVEGSGLAGAKLIGGDVKGREH